MNPTVLQPTLQPSSSELQFSSFPQELACEDRKIAVECDGPEHFLQVLGNETLRVENGPTKAKCRILQILGWTVINLDRNEVINNQVNEQWLRDKLLDANVDLSYVGVPTISGLVGNRAILSRGPIFFFLESLLSTPPFQPYYVAKDGFIVVTSQQSHPSWRVYFWERRSSHTIVKESILVGT